MKAATFVDDDGVKVKFTIFGVHAELVLGVPAVAYVNKWWQLVRLLLACGAWSIPFLSNWRVAHSSLSGNWCVARLVHGAIGT